MAPGGRLQLHRAGGRGGGPQLHGGHAGRERLQPLRHRGQRELGGVGVPHEAARALGPHGTL